jgi:hypothetical protein
MNDKNGSNEQCEKESLHNLNYAANIQFAEVRRILMKNNNAKEEDNNIDRSLLLLLDSNHTETVNTLIIANANTINTSNAKDNEKSQEVNWWINELDSLGINKSKQKESNKSQELEDLTDDIKQKFIYDYKACYSV